MNEIETVLSEIDGGRLLDVATGGGAFLQFLVEHLRSYSMAIGVDSSEQRIAMAQESLGGDKIEFQTMDAREMSFDSESFDTVAISNSLHHMEAVEPVLNEMVRVLRPGGTLIINEMFRDFQDKKQAVFVAVHNWWAAIDRTHGIVHNQTYLKDELIGFVRKLDLTGVKIFEVPDQPPDTDGALDSSWLIEKIDEYIGKIDEDSEHVDLIDQGRRIRDDVLNIGFAKPTELMIFGKV